MSDYTAAEISTQEGETGHWWIVLCLLLLAQIYVIGLAVAYLNLGFDDLIPGYIYRASFYGYLGLLPIGGIAFVFDRRICKARSEWTPSLYYFLLTLPLVFNVVICGLYLYRRHKYLGVP